MAGVTLSVEEIRAAPPEVRRWLEQEIVRALRRCIRAGTSRQPAPPPLIGCNVEEVREMLALVQGVLPVVSVFFELGREAAGMPVHGMRAFPIADIQRHSRLHAPAQVIECLDLLTDALRRVRGDAEAAFYALDNLGHCLVAEATMRSILRLWQEIVAQQALQASSGAATCRARNASERQGEFRRRASASPARTMPTATGVASPSVWRVSVNDTTAPISASAPASTNAEEKLPVACTI